MNKRIGDEIWFIYDDLIKPSEMKKSKINGRFLSFALMKGILFKICTTGRNYNKMIPEIRLSAKSATKDEYLVGGLFLINKSDYRKLYAYYNNTKIYSGNELSKVDLYKCITSSAYPIRFNEFEEIEEYEYELSHEVRVKAFFCNEKNLFFRDRIKRFRNRVSNRSQVLELFKHVKGEQHGVE